MDPIVEDASNAVLDFELHRLHYTYSMVDFDTFREDYRYVYRNGGTVPHSVAPLLWRNRAVQANMYVLDDANKNLVYLPSEMTRTATQLSLTRLFQGGVERSTSQGHQAPAPNDIPTPSEIEAALAFESPRASRELVYNKAIALSQAFPGVPEFEKTASLLQFALEYYRPLALLSEPIKPGGLSFLRHGVDLYLQLATTPSSTAYSPLGIRLGKIVINILVSLVRKQTMRWKLGRLFVGGRYDFEVPLALDAVDASGARSFHLRVTIPSGLRVAPSIGLKPTEVFAGTELPRFASYDESNVYLYLGSGEIQSVLERRDAVKADRERELAKARSSPQAERITSMQSRFKRPTIIKWLLDFLIGLRAGLLDWVETEAKLTMKLNVPLYLARGIRPLIAFLWVPTVIMMVAAYYGVATPDFFVATISVLFVVVLTIGIFAIDRRVLRGLVLAHAGLALAVSILVYALSRIL